jgi:hypothetical protein
MPKDPAELVTPILDGLLAPAEQSAFSGHTVIPGATDRRLVLQAVDRKFRPKDDASSIRPDELARAHADGAGSAWWTTTAAIMDSAALKVRLETTTGSTRTLTMMRSTAMFGKFGGGEAQQHGIEALAEWLRAAG